MAETVSVVMLFEDSVGERILHQVPMKTLVVFVLSPDDYPSSSFVRVHLGRLKVMPGFLKRDGHLENPPAKRGRPGA